MTGYWVVFCLLACGELLVRVNTEVATETCVQDSDCSNGMNCRIEEDIGFCLCVPGLSGEKCEVIDDCKTGKFKKCNDGIGGECKFLNGKSVCECKDGKEFDTTLQVCREPCNENSDCMNGMECWIIEDVGFCKCVSGLSGDRCDIIDDCETGKFEKCNDEIGGECKFLNGKSVCECKDGKEFDILLGVCRVTCGGKECQNGALKCNADNKCECQEGWTGDTCAEVFGCTDMLIYVCNELGLECIYDRVQSAAICKCLQENELFNGTHCIDACFSNPCKNDGICTAINSTDYLCECKQPFSGNHCERHPCHSNPCLNDGTCIAVENINYGCVCDEPFHGRHCEKDPCTPSPCKNAGLCEVVGIDFICNCKSPYFGKQCEIEFNTTDLEYTITNHFSGEITTNTYECYCGENSVSCRLNWMEEKLCFCKEGYEQRRGTDICSRTCQSNADCRNDGICDRDGPGYFCLCPEPFVGDRCELDVCNSVRFDCRSRGAECVRQGTIGVCKCPRGKKMSLFNYCEDICTDESCVHGTCKITDYHFSQYVCNCYEGYWGSRCENALVMQYTPAIIILVSLASGIVLFSITSIVAGCWVKKLRKKIAENTKQTGQP